MRKLTSEGKIIMFKSLAISKNFALSVNNKSSKYWDWGIEADPKKTFLWDNKKVKIKQSTSRNDYKDGSLKERGYRT